MDYESIIREKFPTCNVEVIKPDVFETEQLIEYITDDNANDRLVIMDDLISLLCFLTDFNKSTIKRLVIRDIKIYFYSGWRWDFL